jgi:hypothetical protein
MGIAYHKALETNYLHKIQHRTDMPIADVLDAFHDSWTKSLAENEDIDWGNDDPGTMMRDGLNFVELYMNTVAPTITPLSVEASISGIILGVKFTGRIDLIKADGTVVDHKTAKASYNQDSVDREMQPCAYGFGLGREIDFDYHVVVKKKKPETQIVSTHRTMKEINWWVEMVEQDLQQMQTGIAPPRPDGWQCTPKMCGYWKLCRGEMARTSFSFAESKQEAK